MQVICSPVISRLDLEIFKLAHLERSDLLRSFKLAELNFAGGTLSPVVASLLATRRLEVRFATLPDDPTAIYHEKIGIFEDEMKNRVAFSGSANETFSALRRNFEVVEVFRSWEPTEQKRVLTKLNDFERLWESETDKLQVRTFAQAAAQGILSVTELDENLGQKEATNPTKIPTSELRGIEEPFTVPSDIKLFEHQQKAIRAWFKAGGHGIFEMATGSGKTVASLATASALYGTLGGPLFILIVCPYLHLAAQWLEVCLRFGLDPIQCAIERSKWHQELSITLYNLAVGGRQLGSAVTTNSTFLSPSFQSLVQTIAVPSLIIADEVHNFGAPGLRNSLPHQFRYRLGLSATPERHFDEEGTSAIREYFGPSVAKYSIDQALADDVLCRYRYYPIVVELTDSEMHEYYEITTRIAREVGSAESLEGDGKSDLVEALLLRRARIIATAENKLPLLQRLMQERKSTRHNLVYCGDGSIESPIDATVSKQMDLVIRMLGNQLNMRVARYVAATPLLRRETLRRDFAEGNIQCLVAIRCLDEGVDIPETRTAFILASSSNPRQFIQRRGRILRRSPGKDFAEIFDFITTPPEASEESGAFKIDRHLVRKELSRVATFAKNAVNGPEALAALLPIRTKLNLLDVF